MPEKKVNAALMQPFKLSAELQAVVGAGPMPRSEVVKQLWVYIKAQGLQDTTNKRMINSDEKLKAVFAGKSQVSMFEIGKLISPHLSK